MDDLVWSELGDYVRESFGQSGRTDNEAGTIYSYTGKADGAAAAGRRMVG